MVTLYECISTGDFPEASKNRARYSLRFLVPGICYAVNNNLYLYALTMIAPPIWVILVSMRTVITTLTYKVKKSKIWAIGLVNYLFVQITVVTATAVRVTIAYSDSYCIPQWKG